LTADDAKRLDDLLAAAVGDPARPVMLSRGRDLVWRAALRAPDGAYRAATGYGEVWYAGATPAEAIARAVANGADGER